MLGPRWHKVIADLWSNKTRSLLTILTIAVGVFAVGFVGNLNSFIMQDMNADFQSANAHSAVIYCAPFDDSLLPAARQTPGVKDVQGRSGITARMLVAADTKVRFDLFSIPPLSEMRLDLLKPVQSLGTQTLPNLDAHEMYVERSTAAGLQIKPGDTVKIELTDGRVRELRVAALVHDVTAPPFSSVRWGTSYVTPETMEWLGGSRDYNQLLVAVADRPTDDQHVTTVAQAVADKLKKSGREVYQVYVYRPGRHPALDTIQGAMIILYVLGAMAVFLSVFLVINTITGLLGQHIRQIGIMKAVGGGMFQIVGMYFGLVVCFGVLALVVAMPLSALAAYNVAVALSDFGHYESGPFRLPLESALLQTVIALIVPLAAAAWPVINSARITVREAIASYGLGKGHFGKSWMDRLVEQVRFLSRPMLISLRNSVRRKG
jgi:putative ABC transport system permease protein